MRVRQRDACRGAVAVALTAGLIATATPVAVAEEPSTGSGERDHSVTLVTGDRLRVDGDRVVGYAPGPGRSNVPLHKYEENGHQFAIPGDAEPLVLSGKLDRRLFDVTSLVDFGYDDSKRDTVPVIVRSAAGVRSGGVPAMSVRQGIEALGAVSGDVPKSGSAWDALRQGVVEKVWLDGRRQVSVDRSTRQIGADRAWEAGFTGKGVKVAVLDTGVDEKHPDLVGKQVAERNFSGAPDLTDVDGHGTHVASTIASKGEKYRGVAPDAQILDGKVLDDNGGGAESWILAGMQWAVDQGAHVINMSLGGMDTPQVDPIEEALDRLSRASGALFVVAAGNSGPGAGTIGSPGSAEQALTVGAVNRDDTIASFSSRGPSADGGVKPDVTAPGVGIVAAKAGTSDHVAMSGTSMATPHVAGVAALLKQQHPDWPGQRIKAQMAASAKANPDLGLFDQGNGRVDVPKSLTQQVIVEPSNLNLGLRQWPHDDDQKVVRQLTYRNSGAAPVTFDLNVDVNGPGGKAPEGMFTLSSNKVTVPAGGAVEVTLIADTAVHAPDGTYSGLVSTSTGTRTLVAINREVESYDAPFTVLDAGGQPTTGYKTTFINTGTGHRYDAIGQLGTRQLRLPKGDYLVRTLIDMGDERFAYVVRPSFQPADGTALTFDARTAKPVVLRTPDPNAKSGTGSISFVRNLPGGRYYDGWFFPSLAGHLWTAQLGPGSPDFSTTIAEQFAGTPRDANTPVTYRLMWTERGRVPTGYERTAEPAELAEMTVGFRDEGPGNLYIVGAEPIADNGAGGEVLNTRVPAGGRAVELVTASGVQWSWNYERTHEQRGFQYLSGTPFRTVQAGQKYELTLGTPVLGPSVPRVEYRTFARLGDDMTIGAPLFTDSNGGRSHSATTAARITLSRDGTKIGEATGRSRSLFTVPPGEGAYRAEMEQTRDAELSSKVSAVWTFKSRRTTKLTALAQTVVRFLPELDGNGTAHGRTLLVPLKIEQQAGTPKLRQLAVELSFDDGRTWRQAPVVGGKALVRHEKGAQFATLRARTTDAAGNTGDVTITRAYRIAG
ncbi:subtilase family protein [Lentzea atacamensis]|uniref:Subtilase family protein n=1 Tax=Lentzea atacamensis TaxID=531938 RepID=A0ABX9E0N6_9PSEU|nr:subtilase family protein [Lentzea atacamensis]